MLLSDFNYFFNKALCQYVNKRYNVYDTNQQTTDDLRVLKATAVLEPKKVTESDNGKLSEFLTKTNSSKLFDGTYEVNLPLDYLHMLNCICIYEVDSRYKCYDKGDRVQFAARRLTADSWSIIVNDFYNRPLPERPYYYIHNINTDSELPTNPISNSTTLNSSTKGTDVSDNAKLPRTISLKGIANNSLVEKEAGVRYGNPTNVRMEIRCGLDSSVFKLIGVFIDYIKTPLTIRLTQTLVNLTEDTSQIMEFPDYVCQEIINELVNLVMENTADPRLLTHIPVSLSIASPAQQLTQTRSR